MGIYHTVSAAGRPSAVAGPARPPATAPGRGIGPGPIPRRGRRQASILSHIPPETRALTIPFS